MSISRAFALAVLLAAVPAAAARSLADIRASGEIRLATSGDFKPFNDERSGTFGGFEVEIGNAVARTLGVKPVWIKKPFDELLAGVNRDEYDLVLASHSVTSTRAQLVDFTNPHYCSGGVLLARAGGPLTGRELENRAIGVEGGSTFFGYANKLPFKKRVRVYGNAQQAILGVVSRQVDVTVTNLFTALDAVKTYPKANLVVSAPLWSGPVGLAVAKGNDSLRLAVNAALAELQQGGAYRDLALRYFGRDVRCDNN